MSPNAYVNVTPVGTSFVNESSVYQGPSWYCTKSLASELRSTIPSIDGKFGFFSLYNVTVVGHVEQ